MNPHKDGAEHAVRPGELLLVRHGHAWCNADQVIGGPASCRGLTPTGRQQADRLAAEHRTGRPLDAVYASPLLRARQTADIVAAILDMPVVAVDGLREPDYGSVDGARWADIVAVFGAAPALHPDQSIAPGAEPRLAHLARVRATLTAILDRHQGERVLIVAHGDTVTAAHHLFLDVQPGRYCHSPSVDQASLTTWRQQPASWLRPEDGLAGRCAGTTTSPTSTGCRRVGIRLTPGGSARGPCTGSLDTPPGAGAPAHTAAGRWLSVDAAPSPRPPTRRAGTGPINGRSRAVERKGE